MDTPMIAVKNGVTAIWMGEQEANYRSQLWGLRLDGVDDNGKAFSLLLTISQSAELQTFLAKFLGQKEGTS